MESNYEVALDFLQGWSAAMGGCPVTVHAIEPAKKTLVSHACDTGARGWRARCRRWLSDHAASNIYYDVNPTRAAGKKALLEDVLRVEWIHVDVDPRAREDLAREQARIQALIERHDGLPDPTCVIFSGGGFQAFWKLSPPIALDGTVAAADEAARKNVRVGLLLDGDACHAVDHIMRVPGTVNWPDTKKAKLGRVPVLSELVTWEPSRVYAPDVFQDAPRVKSEGARAEPVTPGAKPLEIHGASRLDTLDDLQVSDLVKVVIAQGMDPDNPGRWPSRSEPLFWAVCEMVRADVPDETIFAIITDPGWQISESVLDKGKRASRYASHQIRQARDKAIAPELMELNQRHAVIENAGGGCKIMGEEIIRIGDQVRTRTYYQSFGDFHNRYSNRHVQVKDPSTGKITHAPLGKWWTNHPKRRQYTHVVYDPEGDIPGVYNMWQGFAVDPRPGECGLYLRHLRDNICAGDEGSYDYLLNWMAQAVQHPGLPGHVAIVLRGNQGTGKGAFARTFGQLFGRHFEQIADPKHLVGQFNSHLMSCSVLFVDEAFFAGDKRHEGLLKGLITEDAMMVEAKYVNLEAHRNCLHIIMASNSDWVVPAGPHERRFFVLDVGDGSMQDAHQFAAMHAQMNSGGREALLHLLLTRDLSTFDVRKLPRTRALAEQRVLSFRGDEEWWHGRLEAGELLAGSGEWPERVLIAQLAADYTQYARSWSVNQRGNETRLGRFLRRAIPVKEPFRVQLSGTHDVRIDGEHRSLARPWAYNIPPLDQCRKHWSDSFGGGFQWQPIDQAACELANPRPPF